MPRPSFRSLTQELLDAGIAPRFAERLRRELEDHYRDLEQEALAGARSARAAADEARRRLGTNELITREFLNRPELKSWIYRSSWAVHCLRGLCRIYLGLRGAVRLVAAHLDGVARFAAAGAAAVVLTAGLLLVLQTSISGGPPGVVRALGPVRTIAAAGPAAARIEAEGGARAEDPRPGEIFRPELERPQLPAPALPEHVARESPMVAVEIEMTLGTLPEMRVVDADLLPIVKVAPRFPVVAARRGIEGYVLIEYTVTRTGSVSDVVVVESSSEVFEQPALEAVSKFKYKPRVVDGRAVPVRGVRTRMRFVLEA